MENKHKQWGIHSMVSALVCIEICTIINIEGPKPTFSLLDQ